MIPPGHAIEVAWAVLARHAELCEAGCRSAVEEFGRSPEQPGQADAELHGRMCQAGADLHVTWVDARNAWLESSRPYRHQLGVLGLDQAGVLLRDRAWSKVPNHERRRMLELPDHERFRLLESIEAGLANSLGRAVMAAAPGPRCDNCGKTFVARRPSDRYCSRACRRRLESTEP